MRLHKWTWRARTALLLGAALLVAGVPARAQNSTADTVVQRAIREGRGLPVIVQYKDASAARAAANALPAAARKRLASLPIVSFHADAVALKGLLNNPHIKNVSFDALMESTQSGTAVSIDGSGARVARNRYRVSGAGLTVAVIDSGVQPHQDLPSSAIKRFVDYVNGQTQPYDDYGHGTHVAGIISGTGAASNGQYTGVAPNASIVALKVLDGRGRGQKSNVLAALDYVSVNASALGIKVVNLSLGHPVYESAATDPMVQLVEKLSRQGVVVVVSAGNAGRGQDGATVYKSVTVPANSPSAIAVGATDTMGTLQRHDDVVTGYSSRGPSRFDGYLKPDVVAPGQAIVSLLAANSYLITTYPHLQVAPGYMRLNGTSMAAPLVAGAAGLILQSNPKLTPNAVKGILQYTAQRVPNTHLVAQGAGEVNVAGAVRLAKMINTDVAANALWIRAKHSPTRADLLFGQQVVWGRATLWGGVLYTDRSIFVNINQWNLSTVWGQSDNIVWSHDDNIVWGNSSTQDDNIVWGTTDDNIVWGQSDDNIVWGQDDNVVWGNDDNIVWGQDDNIVWGNADESTLVDGQSESDLTASSDDDNVVWGNSVLVGEVQ